jgi:ubiquinone/menaquinone biosynthesis C-methylase UbiE
LRARRSVCVEIGSGTGFTTGLLAERFAMVMAVDLSAEMLARAPRVPGHRVLADAAQLPVPDGSVDAAVLVNALLFPAEVRRVLGPSGVVVWVNTSGDATPIYLSADDVAEALPGAWDGVSSTFGDGTWCVVWPSQ